MTAERLNYLLDNPFCEKEEWEEEWVDKALDFEAYVAFKESAVPAKATTGFQRDPRPRAGPSNPPMQSALTAKERLSIHFPRFANFIEMAWEPYRNKEGLETFIKDVRGQARIDPKVKHQKVWAALLNHVAETAGGEQVRLFGHYWKGSYEPGWLEMVDPKLGASNWYKIFGTTPIQTGITDDVRKQHLQRVTSPPVKKEGRDAPSQRTTGDRSHTPAGRELSAADALAALIQDKKNGRKGGNKAHFRQHVPTQEPPKEPKKAKVVQITPECTDEVGPADLLPRELAMRDVTRQAVSTAAFIQDPETGQAVRNPNESGAPLPAHALDSVGIILGDSQTRDGSTIKAGVGTVGCIHNSLVTAYHVVDLVYVNPRPGAKLYLTVRGASGKLWPTQKGDGGTSLVTIRRIDIKRDICVMTRGQFTVPGLKATAVSHTAEVRLIAFFPSVGDLAVNGGKVATHYAEHHLHSVVTQAGCSGGVLMVMTKEGHWLVVGVHVGRRGSDGAFVRYTPEDIAFLQGSGVDPDLGQLDVVDESGFVGSVSGRGGPNGVGGH